MSYFKVSCSEDGDVECREIDPAELLKDLAEYPQAFMDVAALEKAGADMMYWGGLSLLIKGEIVVPEAVESVTKYELP